MHYKKINLDDFSLVMDANRDALFFELLGGVFHLQKILENFYWEFWEFPFVSYN